MGEDKKRIVKNKVFQDATQGYIEIDSVYVKYLIDTLYLQREKNVSQVGIRSVYSGATHDRFSHSLGVYGMGTKLYNSLRKSLLNELGSNSFFTKKVSPEVVQSLRQNIDNDYEVLYIIACLLHDIGHPAFSHTLEYLYEDDFINLGFELSDFESCVELENLIESSKKSKQSSEINEEEVARIIKRYNWIQKERINDYVSSSKNNHKNYLKQTFEKALNKAEGGKNYGGEMHASPHEIMGAYQILTSSDIRENIQYIFDDKEVEINLDDACAFIARMITGKKYDIYSVIASNPDKPQDELKLDYSLRNCIIMLLNGSIDADSLDYLNRNSHFSGYATNNLDVTRLCNAFQISFDDKKRMFDLCIYKSALSSLDDFIQARNFEPRWLYSHHKIVYFNEVLIEYLMKMASAYMYEDIKEPFEKLLLKCLFDYPKLYNTLDFQFTKGNLEWSSYYEEFNEQDKPYTKYTEKTYWNKFKDLCALCMEAYNKDDPPKPELLEDEKNKAAISQQEKPLNLKFSILKFVCFVEEKLIEIFKDPYVESEKKFKILVEITGFIQYADDIVRRLKYIYIHYILSPILSFKQGKNNLFFKSTDATINTLFNSLSLSSNEIRDCKPADPTLAFRYELFVRMLNEFRTRQYKKSLWKTYDEYKIFINTIANVTGFPYDLVNEKFIELIQSVSGTAHCIEFEDFTQAKTKDNLNCIYVNCDDDEIEGLDKQNEFLRNFTQVFGHIGKSMIIRLHLCKFKNFDNLNIKFSNQCKKYREVSDYKTPKSYIFPYVFLEENESIETILKKLEENFTEYLINEITQKSIATGSDDMSYTSLLKGKIIRDSVHGDIFVEQKYLDIINTAAFQRLHRIRQLATANMIFPEAVHTRFAHSLGTFHVMNLIMNHFCNILDALKISYNPQDKEVVLVAALLHDIGHGPFSHALEELNNIDGFSVKKHEKWTLEIIKNDTELNKVLENNFGSLFVFKVIDCLESKNSNQSTLSKVFHELISSNLDADRLDYLLRDSYNTGEQIGIFDLQKLISSMELTEYNGETRVVIRDSALQYVDQYILGRYHMYSSVYYTPFKLATEELFRRLCTIIAKYPQICEINGDLKKQETCKKIKDFKIYKLCFNKITEEEFLAFDDYSIINEIKEGLHAIGSAENNELYKLLSDSFMYRNNAYKRKRIGNGEVSAFNKVSKELKKKFPDIDKLQSVIKLSKTFYAYKQDTEEEILIISSNGEVKPYSQVSKFKNNFKTDKKLFASECCCYYFNRDICEKEIMSVADFKKYDANKIEELFDAYNLRNHTEIENKYHCDEDTLNNIVDTLKNGFTLGDYTITVPPDFEKNQQDIYYDTDLFVMAKNKYSLRIRTIGENHVLTIKKPGKIGEKNEETQFIRLEFEKNCAENSINCTDSINAMDENDLQAEISQKLHGFNYSDLKPVITVINSRKTYQVMHESSKNVLFEISLDDVEYKNISDGKTKKVYQVEIELKESYIYRLNLDDFATKFCKKFSIETDGNKPKLSKYLEALNLFDLI